MQEILFKNEKSAQRGSFWRRHPADIRGLMIARISRPKTSVRAVELLEKNKHFGADIHDPKARTSTTLRGFQKLRSEKLWAEFSFPISEKVPSVLCIVSDLAHGSHTSPPPFMKASPYFSHSLQPFVSAMASLFCSHPVPFGGYI